ncbi:MAG: molybdopterin-binding oxidoreductase, partial [Streptosporangiaceae bacterium]
MTPPTAAGDQHRRRSALAGAVAGVLTAAVAMGIGQLFAGLTNPESSPVIAVGQASIDLTPPALKDFAISTFGANDKTALLTGILVVLAVFAAVIGMLAVRRLERGLAGLAVFAGIGLAAALTRPDATPAYAIPTLAGAAAGAFALTRLVRRARALGVPAAPARPARSSAGPPSGSRGSRAFGTTVVPLKPPDLPEPEAAGALGPPD